MTKYIFRRSACSILRVRSPFKQFSSVLDTIPEALRELIDIAESTRSTLTEREIIAARYREQQQAAEGEITEVLASGSGTCHHDTPHDLDAP